VAGLIRLQWRPFGFVLPQPLATAAGTVHQRRGWLLRAQGSEGALGWGEAAPLDGQLKPLAAAIEALGSARPREALEAALEALDRGGLAPVFKWKVAVLADSLERELLEQLLQRLPAAAQLRLDANGGWTRATAMAWAERLGDEPRLQWLEQPLDPADQAGLATLAERVPVALDESLQRQPALRQSWLGWQVRRPSQEGDPRPLLAGLEQGAARLMLSTAFETGIARRWLEHLAAVQAEGPTPVAPGLAPGWQAPGGLASRDPEVVWSAAPITGDQAR
jgi:O-succinylbenzoate synthase